MDHGMGLSVQPERLDALTLQENELASLKPRKCHALSMSVPRYLPMLVALPKLERSMLVVLIVERRSQILEGVLRLRVAFS